MFNAGLTALGFATAKHNKNRGTPFEFRSAKGFVKGGQGARRTRGGDGHHVGLDNGSLLMEVFWSAR